MDTEENLPLVSVIIASYNYGKYVGTAIRSVLGQTHQHTELIVVDDGSTDDTADIVGRYQKAIYHYQPNRGLSAARNAGVRKSSGQYLLFLDADDWLEPTGIADNIQGICRFPEMAFISGNYYLFRQATQETIPAFNSLTGETYPAFLKSNYVGMLAAVLFRRSLFNEFQFDESLGACEDYDLYLRITRSCPAMHHEKFIATYFFHPDSLSHNYQVMIKSLREVMRRQHRQLRTLEEQIAYAQGKDQWKQYECLQQSTAAVAALLKG